MLQQYLPFTVLKRIHDIPPETLNTKTRLQQYLPFTVLKHIGVSTFTLLQSSCNSTYRLRH